MKNTTDYYIQESNNLIYSLVNQYRRYGLEEDLYQAGIVGLMEAYQRYDPMRGVKFSTYAYPYILGEMKKYARNNHSLKVGRELLQLNYKINHVMEVLTQRLGRIPSDEELATFLEVDKFKIEEARKAVLYVRSLSEPIYEEESDLTIADTIAAMPNLDQDDLIWLKDELKNLPKDERKLILLRYVKEKTQQEVAKELGISQVQVSRNEQRVLSKLRNTI